MNKIALLLLFSLTLLSCSSTTKAPKQTNKTQEITSQNQNTSNSVQKPNILFIHVDDLGYHDLSLTGSKLYDTPTIDKLAKESVQFTNAYASYPRCVPSRYGLYTATYPVNENKGNITAIPDDKNIIKQLDKAGYNTYYIGKWHLNERGQTPKVYGFKDTYAAGAAGGIASHLYSFNVDVNGKPGKYVVPDIEEDGRPGDCDSDLLTDAAINFIKNNPKDKPFFLALAFYAVHTPIEAKEKDIKRNKDELKHIDFGDVPEYTYEDGRQKMRQDNPRYAGMVENVDENVNRLLDLLQKLNIDDNTIVILTSDHGGLSNSGKKKNRELATTNLPLRAGKGWLYEGGIRVPLFVKWPGKFKPRVDNNSIVLGMDILPTVLDLTTNKKVQGVDGKSFKNVLTEAENWKDRTVFWHERKARPNRTGEHKADVVRSGDYKLIDFYGDGRIELYNLKKDPGEKNNLADKMPALKKELLVKLNKWRAEYLVPEKLNVGKTNKKHKHKKNKKKKK